MKPCLLFLTCADGKEADKIVNSLLAKKLIVCAKKFPVNSSFLWEGKIDSGNEIMVVMDSAEKLFGEVEKEVRKIHSYDTFVLLATSVTHSSKGVEKWMRESLKK